MGHTMLDAVEPNAVILMREDVYVNALRYLQVIDNVRPDVRVIPLDALWWPWMKELVERNVLGFVVPGKVLRQEAVEPGDFTLKQLIEANVDHAPLYISKLYPTEEQTLRGVYNGFPYGFHSRVRREGAEFGLAEVLYEAGPFINLRLPEWKTHRWESWETFVYKNYFDVKIPMAQMMVKHSKGRVDWLTAAADVYAGVAAQSADYRPLVLAQLGEIDALLSQVDDTYRLKAIQAWDELLALHPQENEMVKKIRESLAALKSRQK